MARTAVSYKSVYGIRRKRGQRLHKGRTWFHFPSDWHRKHGHRYERTYIYRRGKKVMVEYDREIHKWVKIGRWKKA